MGGLEKHCDGRTRDEEELRVTSHKVTLDLGLLPLNRVSQTSRGSLISPWAVKASKINSQNKIKFNLPSLKHKHMPCTANTLKR